MIEVPGAGGQEFQEREEEEVTETDYYYFEDPTTICMQTLCMQT